MGIEPDDHGAGLVKLLERPRQRADAAEKRVLHRARRCAERGGGERSCVVLRPDDRRCSKGNGGANDCAEVLRILDLVEGDDDRLRVLGEALDDHLEGHEREIGGIGDRALMPCAPRHAIELEAIDARHRGAASLGEAGDGVDLWAALPHEVDLPELVAVNTDRFANRLEPSDQPHARAPAFCFDVMTVGPERLRSRAQSRVRRRGDRRRRGWADRRRPSRRRRRWPVPASRLASDHRAPRLRGGRRG